MLEFGRWLVERGALPLALVMVPVLYQRQVNVDAERARNAAAEAAKKEQQFRLHVEMLSKREEADTAVRRGLFDRLLGSYLDPGSKNVEDRLVALAMLTFNFHDSLILSPLFWELDRLIAAKPDPKYRAELREALDGIAQYAKRKQASVLEIDGEKRQFAVKFDDIRDNANSPAGRTFVLRRLREDGRPMTHGETIGLTLDVLKHDAVHRRLLVTASVHGVEGAGTLPTFWVDPYDMPLLNFTRLSPTERFSVLLESYDAQNQQATLWLVYFPSTRTGAKDRPYIDDLMKQLLLTPSAPAPAEPTPR